MRKILSITLISILCIATFTTSCTKNKPIEGESVALEGIVFTNISNNSLTLNAGETYAITYKLLPENFKVGDEIDVAVTEFNPESKRVTLSRKATMEQPQEVKEDKE